MVVQRGKDVGVARLLLHVGGEIHRRVTGRDMFAERSGEQAIRRRVTMCPTGKIDLGAAPDPAVRGQVHFIDLVACRHGIALASYDPAPGRREW
jgi:hypothetical protein